MKIKNFMFMAAACFLCSCESKPDLPDDDARKTDAKFALIAKGELRGAGKEEIRKQNTVIATPEAWNNLKSAINSTNNISFAETEVDFSAYRVLAVFDGVRENDGWNIEITDMTEYPDSLVVNVKNSRTGNADSVISQPFHIVKIPISDDKKLVFKSEIDDGQYYAEGYVSGYDRCGGFETSGKYGKAKGYYIIDNTLDTLLTYNLPDNLFQIPIEFFDKPYLYFDDLRLKITYRLATESEKINNSACQNGDLSTKQAIIVSAVGIGNGETTDESENGDDNNYPIEIETKDYSLGCEWLNPKTIQDSIYVINSFDELLRAFGACNKINDIDFDKYSLLFVYGGTASGIAEFSKSLQQISSIGYTLNVDIKLDMTTVAQKWNIAVLVPKLSKNASVRLNKNVQLK